MKRLILAALIMFGFAFSQAHAQEKSAKLVPSSKAQISLSFAPVVKQTTPAVVNVFADRIERQAGFRTFGQDPLFRRFFGGEDLFGRPRERVKKSLGSGVIVEGSGYVVTNHHVIRNGNDIRVVLTDRREFEAKVLVTDKRTDLAILKIDTKGEELPSLRLGDSDALEVGDLVLAIGNPFGVGQTVTSGIVSALARTRVGVSSYQFFIQTDAAINPGNSGGALVNLQGDLVGINTAIFSRSGGSHGIGFAIPVNMVKSVIQSARAGGRVVRAWSGIDVQEVTTDIAESFGLSRPSGALVVDAHPLSPLLKAGIKRGDVIATVNGKEIGNAREFAYRFATIAVGKTAEMTVLRGKKKFTAKVNMIAPPEVPDRKQTLVRGNSPFTGLEVANLSPALADELNLKSNVRGVAIVKIAGGIAARVRVFRPGDVIVELNGRPIRELEDLRTSLRRAEGYWEFILNRKGRMIPVQLGG